MQKKKSLVKNVRSTKLKLNSFIEIQLFVFIENNDGE